MCRLNGSVLMHEEHSESYSCTPRHWHAAAFTDLAVVSNIGYYQQGIGRLHNEAVPHSSSSYVYGGTGNIWVAHLDGTGKG